MSRLSQVFHIQVRDQAPYCANARESHACRPRQTSRRPGSCQPVTSTDGGFHTAQISGCPCIMKPVPSPCSCHPDSSASGRVHSRRQLLVTMSELPLTVFNRVGNDHDHYQKDHLLRECKHYDSKQNIADSIGYGDSFSFSKAFHRSRGCSPTDFRRMRN